MAFAVLWHPAPVEGAPPILTRPCGAWALFCWSCKGGTLARTWPVRVDSAVSW